jgi:hypothetical protein
MKRSPLIRKRRLYRPPRRPEADKVSPELHAAVLRRDRMCVMARMAPEGHKCKTVWGREHAPDDLALLTIEHVHDTAMMGKRAPSDLAHCIALCGAANFAVPSKAMRDWFRAYLETVDGTP